MSYNWIHQADKQVNNNSKTRTKKHFLEINAKEKFQDVDSPLNIPLKRTRRSNGDSDSDSDSDSNNKQITKNTELFLEIRKLKTKRQRGKEDPQPDAKRQKGIDDQQPGVKRQGGADNSQLNVKRLKSENNPQSEDDVVTKLKKHLEKGADINFIDRNDGDTTLLHLTVKKGYAKVVSYLLKNGADIIADKKGKTPLDLANDLGLNDIVTILETYVQSNLLIDSLQQLWISDEKMPLNEGQLKKLNQPDKEGNTSLLRAVNSCKPEDINLLVQYGADVNYQNPNTKQRAIDVVWENGYYDTMLALLKADSYFPKDFTLDALYMDPDIPSELKEFVKKREELHTWIKDDKLIEVSSFVKNGVSKFFNCENKSAQEIAAVHASTRTLKATVGIISDDEEGILSETQKKLVDQINSEGDSLLLIAAKNGKKDNMDFLIQCGVDVNYKNPKTNKGAVDIVWENGYYDTMLALLKEDSHFPQGFKLESLNANNNSQKQLKDFVQARNKLHKSIEEGNLQKVKDFIVTDKSRFYFNSQGQSAVLTAIKNKKYEIYAFLKSISKDYHYEEAEEINAVHNKLSPGEKEILKSVMIPYFPPVEDAHIWYLISKSRARKPIDNFKTKVENFYRKLDAIPEISKLLQVVQHIDHLDIIFDFDNEYIEDVNPTASKSARGITDYKEGRIYIAAKRQEDKVLGTLAHELTHLAMQIIYENDCKPYIKSDTDKAQKFAEITEDIKNQENIKQAIHTIQNNYNVDDSPITILARAFMYPKDEQESELIVRIPHILTQYKEEGKKAFINDNNYKELTLYYDSNVVPEYQNYIDRSFFTKPRSIIRSLNQVVGEVYNIQELNIKFQSPINLDYSFDSNKGKPFLLLKSKNTLLSSLSIYQVLQDKSYYADNYLLLKFEHYVKHTEQINKAFYFEVNKLLVVEYSNNSDNTKLSNVLNTLSELLQQKPQKQVIFIVDASKIDLVKDALSKKLSDKYFEKLDKDYKFSDLTYASKAHILEKQVIFQGKKIRLKDIDDNIREVINADTRILSDFIEGRTKKIGTEPLGVNNLDAFYTKVYQQIPDESLLRIKNDVNALYVINIIGQSDIEIAKNKLIQKCGITKEDIGEFSLDVAVNHKKKILIQLGTIEGDKFKRLCNNIGNNIEDNKKIYWISWKKNKFILNQCTKSFMTRFLYEKAISSNPADSHIDDIISEDEFFKEINEKKIVIIVDEPGMGKSTFLTKLAAYAIDSNWVIRINFSKCTNAIAGLPLETSTLKHVMNFLSKIEGLNHPLTNSLLEGKLQHSTNTKPLLLLFDGFDEIRGVTFTNSNAHKMRVVSLLKFLYLKTKAKMVVTTRDGEGLLLDSGLRSFYRLKDLTDIQKTSYLEKLWKTPLQLTSSDEQLRVLDDKFEIYSKFVFSEMATILREKHPHLLGVPLQLQLFGEGLQSKFVEFIKKNDNSPEDLKIGILDLYKRCIHARYDIFLRAKSNIIADEGTLKTLYKDYDNNHWKLAFKEIFPYYNDKLSIEDASLNKLLSIGIIQHSSDNNFGFNHPTFAEYFFAVRLMKKLGKPIISEVLVQEVFVSNSGTLIRSFLNEYLGNGFLKLNAEEKDKVFTQFRQHIIDLKKKKYVLKNQEQMLQVAAKENNCNIVEFLLPSVTYNKDVTNKFLCARNDYGIGVLHYAAKVGNLKMVDLFISTAKTCDVLEGMLSTPVTSGNFKKIVKDIYLSPLDYALLYDEDVVIFNKLFNEASSQGILPQLTYNKIYGNMLNTALSRASKEHFQNVLSKYLGNRKELLLNLKGAEGNALYWACHGQGRDLYNALYNDLDFSLLPHYRNEVFPVKDDALLQRITDLVTELLDYVKNEKNLGQEELKELFVPTNKKFLPLHRAVCMENYETITKLSDYAKDAGVHENLFLAVDEDGNTALHIASEKGNFDLAVKLLNDVKSIKDNKRTLKELLLSGYEYNSAPLRKAMDAKNTKLAIRLLEEAKSIKDSKGTLKKLLLYGSLGKAIDTKNTEIAIRLLEEAKGIKDNKRTLKKLLLYGYEDGNSPLHKAIDTKNTEIAIRLLEEAKGIKDNKRTLKKLLLYGYEDGNSPLHKAIDTKNTEIAIRLLEEAKGIEDNEETLKKLLFGGHEYSNSPLHKAIDTENTKIAIRLLDEVKGIEDNEETLKKLLFGGHEYSNSPLYKAIDTENTEVEIRLLEEAKGIEDNKETLKKLLLRGHEYSNSPLHKAIHKKNTKIITQLLDYAKFAGNDVLEILTNTIVGQGNTEIAIQLLDATNDVNDEDARKIIFKKLLEFVDQDDNTFLHLAAREGNHMVITKLLNAANNIKAADIKIIKLLNDTDAKAIKYLVVFFNRNQETPFRIGVEKEHSSIIKEFLRAAMEVDDNKETFKKLKNGLVRKGGIRSEYTTQISQIMADFISGSKNKEQVLNSVQNVEPEVQFISQSRDTDSIHSIASTCLPSTSRGKRSTNECKIGWDDVDEISSRKTRNSVEIIIDTDKFLPYLKESIGDPEKSKQLMMLAEEVRKLAAGKVVGNSIHVLDQITIVGGLDKHIQEERMKYVGYNIINRNDQSMGPKLKLLVLDSMGKMQLMRGMHSAIATCSHEIGVDCNLSMAGLGFAFLSDSIVKGMSHITPKMILKSSGIISKVMPKILSYETKSVVHMIGAIHGTKIGAGLGATIGGIFDIIDIAKSSIALIECNKRAGGDNPCSRGEIRNNILSVGFSAAGLASGVLFVVISAPGIGIVVGFALMVGQSVFLGLSNVIEYREKYHITSSEEWSVLGRSILFQDMAPDVQHLAARTDAINKIADHGKKILESSPHVMAFAAGLGAADYKKECNTVFRPQVQGQYMVMNHVTECSAPKLNIAADYVMIDMQNCSLFNAENISRVIPNHMDNIKMICLPKITNADYEKGLSSSSYNTIDAVYYCENAMVLLDERKINSSSGDKWIEYHLMYVNSGSIVTASDLNSAFYIYGGAMHIYGGADHTNTFVLLGSSTIHILLKQNSTNILNIEQPNCRHSIINMMCNNYNNYNTSFAQINITTQSIGIEACVVREDIMTRYVSSKNKVDKIVCYYSHGIESNTYHKYMLVDSGGGVGPEAGEFDSITACSSAIIYPFTIFHSSKDNNYTLYIKSDGYENVTNAVSWIHNTASPTDIIFLEVPLLSGSTQMRYSMSSNILSVEMRMQNNGTYTLDLMNYRDLNKGNNTNYRLVDKIGNTIAPIIIENTEEITSFVLYNSCPPPTIEFDIFGLLRSIRIVDFYNNISHTNNIDYKVFGKLAGCFSWDINAISQLGSTSDDLIVTSQNIVFISGGEGSDTYIHDITGGVEAFIFINNFAYDCELDVLSIIAPYNITITDFKIGMLNYNLILELKPEAIPYGNVKNNIKVQIENYSISRYYQHIVFMGIDGNIVIPLIQKNNEGVMMEEVLVPFYHATLQKNIFILSADGLEQAVVDVDFNNVMFYRKDNNLLLFANSTQDLHPLSIIFTDYYTHRRKWQNVKIYPYNRDSHIYNENSHINLAAVKLSDNNLREYDHLIQEYIVDFTDPVKLIRHNGISLQSRSKIPIVMFKDIEPSRLQVEFTQDDIIILDAKSNHKLQIINWNHDQYPVIFEFNFNHELRPIRIYVSDKDYNSTSHLQDKIDTASRLYLNMCNNINYRLENILKCLISPRITNINEGYAILGFYSPEHQEMFITECNSLTFRMDDSIQFRLLAYLEMLSDYAILMSDNDAIVQQYTNIIDQDITEVVRALSTRFDFDGYLQYKLGNIPLKTVHAAEHLLKVYCDQSYDYDIEGSILDKLIYNLLVDYIETMKENNKDLTCDGEEQYLTSDDSSKAFILLAFKVYNELILKYPGIEEDSLYNNCFSSILFDSHISDMLKYLNVNSTYLNISFHDIDNFVDSNHEDIQLIGSNNNRLINITELFEALDLEVNDTIHSEIGVIDTSHGGDHKHRHHHGENHSIDDHSIRSKRELNKELKQESGNAIDQDNYGNQESTEDKNTDIKSNGWVSWMRWPKFNIFPGAEAAGTKDSVVNQHEYEVDNFVHNYPSIDGNKIHKDIAEDLLIEANKEAEVESSSNTLVDNVTTAFKNDIFPGAEATSTENGVVNQQEYEVDNSAHDTDVVIEEDYSSIDRSETYKDIVEDLLVEDNKAIEEESSSNMLVDNVTTVFTNGMNLFKGTISKISKLISNITNSNSSNYPSDELLVNDNTDYIVRNKATNAASSLAIDDGSNNNNIQEVITGFDLHGTLMLGQYIISKKLGRNNSLSSNYITPKQKHTMEVNKLAATILPFLQNDDFSNDTDDFINSYNNQPQWYRDVYKDEFDKIVGKRDYRANQKDIYENNSSEEILADSISIFGETTVYENNDIN